MVIRIFLPQKSLRNVEGSEWFVINLQPSYYTTCLFIFFFLTKVLYLDHRQVGDSSPLSQSQIPLETKPSTRSNYANGRKSGQNSRSLGPSNSTYRDDSHESWRKRVVPLLDPLPPSYVDISARNVGCAAERIVRESFSGTRHVQPDQRRRTRRRDRCTRRRLSPRKILIRTLRAQQSSLSVSRNVFLTITTKENAIVSL